MLAFAANSLLARAALASGAIDASSFTVLRFAAGAITLAGLVAWQRGGNEYRERHGNWTSAICLFVYGLGFSLAYLRLNAATGALVLFATVQATMIVGGLVRGQRPGFGEALGMAVALTAFVYLLLPGLQAPDPIGSLMMMGAGMGWALYSLRGQGSTFPLGDTAGNFIRATMLAIPLGAYAMKSGHADAIGVVLALASGSVTSGLGYAIWYRALRGLAPIQAASVQLTVPLIATIGGVAFLSEQPTLRLLGAGIFILAGVGLTIATRRPRGRQAIIPTTVTMTDGDR